MAYTDFRMRLLCLTGEHRFQYAARKSLWLYSSSVERALRMHGHPADSAKNRKKRRDGKRGSPSKSLSDPWRERCGNRSTYLSTHVHDARKYSGTAPRNIHGD